VIECEFEDSGAKELLKSFLQKVSSHGSEVVAEEVAEFYD
jgi:hypothetical protein